MELAYGRFRVEVLDGVPNLASDASDGLVYFTSVIGVEEGLPTVTALAQNHPNPFNPQTVIRFGLPRAQEVTLAVYDLQGRRVRTLLQGLQAAGRHEVVWRGRDDRGGEVASGLYFYRLSSEDGQLTRKMLLLK